MFMDLVRVDDLEDAKKLLEDVGVSPEAVGILSKKMVYRIVRVKDLDFRAINILKQDMLSIGGDVACSKAAASFVEEKSDVLIMGTLRQFELLVEKLKQQPFGLKDVGEMLARII